MPPGADMNPSSRWHQQLTHFLFLCFNLCSFMAQKSAQGRRVEFHNVRFQSSLSIVICAAGTKWSLASQPSRKGSVVVEVQTSGWQKQMELLRLLSSIIDCPTCRRSCAPAESRRRKTRRPSPASRSSCPAGRPAGGTTREEEVRRRAD